MVWYDGDDGDGSGGKKKTDGFGISLDDKEAPEEIIRKQELILEHLCRTAARLLKNVRDECVDGFICRRSL